MRKDGTLDDEGLRWVGRGRMDGSMGNDGNGRVLDLGYFIFGNLDFNCRRLNSFHSLDVEEGGQEVTDVSF